MVSQVGLPSTVSLLISLCLQILLIPLLQMLMQVALLHSGVQIIAENESLVGHGDGGEMIQSAKDEVNIGKYPGLWLDFSADG